MNCLISVPVTLAVTHLFLFGTQKKVARECLIHNMGDLYMESDIRWSGHKVLFSKIEFGGNRNYVIFLYMSSDHGRLLRYGGDKAIPAH